YSTQIERWAKAGTHETFATGPLPLLAAGVYPPGLAISSDWHPREENGDEAPAQRSCRRGHAWVGHCGGVWWWVELIGRRPLGQHGGRLRSARGRARSHRV